MAINPLFPGGWFALGAAALKVISCIFFFPFFFRVTSGHKKIVRNGFFFFMISSVFDWTKISP